MKATTECTLYGLSLLRAGSGTKWIQVMQVFSIECSNASNLQVGAKQVQRDTLQGMQEVRGK